MDRIHAPLMAALVLAGCNYKSQPIGGETDVCGHVKTAEREVINGVEEHDPEVVDLTEGQIKSVGALNLDFTGTCSAALIAENVVLTAAHCVQDLTSPPDFLVGDSYLPPEASFSGVEFHIHPDYRPSTGDEAHPPFDLAIIIIDGDTEARGLEPIPVNLEDTSLLSEVIQSVGYGQTDTTGGWNTKRWWTVQQVHTEAPAVYTADDDGESGLCFGDSGGPLLWTKPGEGVMVMAAASAVDSEDCLGNSLYARTDIAADWIVDFLPVIGPCEDETFEGRCQGNMAVWCEDEEVFYHDCSDFDWQCAPDDEGIRRCRPPCGDETFEGRCQGNMAVWCEDEEVFYHACSDFDWICGRNGAGNMRCIEPEPCLGIDHDGMCDGNVAVWCDDDELWYHYCDDFGYTCGEGEDGRFRCLDECATMGFDGECAGDTARWCQYGFIHERDCAACDQECTWTGDLLGFYCE